MINAYALVYLVAYAVPALIGFIALVLYTHLLSPAEYGLYVIGASIAGIVSAVFFAWVRLSVSRYQARSPDLDLRGAATVSYAGTVAVIACLAPAVMLIVRPQVDLMLVAGSLCLSLSLSAFEIGQEFKRARLKPLRFMTIAVIRSCLGLTLGFAAIGLGGGGLGLLFAVAASFLIGNLLNFCRDGEKPLRIFPAEHLSQFVRYGVPFSLGALTFAFASALDRLSVAYLLDADAAGQYGVAADLTRQFIVILASSVASATFPIAFRSHAEDGPYATRERLSEGAELLLALITPVAVWLAVCSDVVAGTLLGSEFRASAAALLPLLAAGRMLGAINQYYLHVSFQLAEKPLLQVAHDTLILVVSIALIVPLTLMFGLMGTATAVLIAEAFGVLVGIWLSRSAFHLPFDLGRMSRVLVSAAIMGAACYAAKVSLGGHGLLALLTVLTVGAVTYAGSAIVLDVARVRTSTNSFLRTRGWKDRLSLGRTPRKAKDLHDFAGRNS
jgi:O-antigen/teichoic acid export membrane protein